jgi:hypothetical protein
MELNFVLLFSGGIPAAGIELKLEIIQSTVQNSPQRFVNDER